jgi:hypothetical protein
MPPEFEELINGDSWQAHHGKRLIYVSSLAVQAADSMPSAQDLCAMASRSFADNLERCTFSSATLVGQAVIYRSGESWELRGVMCAPGSVATCLIEFPHHEDFDWALYTWKSLVHSAA